MYPAAVVVRPGGLAGAGLADGAQEPVFGLVGVELEGAVPV